MGLHAPTRMEHVIVWELSVDHTHLNCHSLCIQSSALVRSHHHGINARSYSCKYTDMLNPRWCLLITLCLRCVMMSLSPINGRCTGCATYGPLDPLARGKTLEAGPLSFHLWWHEASYNIVFIYYKHTMSWIITKMWWFSSYHLLQTYIVMNHHIVNQPRDVMILLMS